MPRQEKLERASESGQEHVTRCAYHCLTRADIFDVKALYRQFAMMVLSRSTVHATFRHHGTATFIRSYMAAIRHGMMGRQDAPQIREVASGGNWMRHDVSKRKQNMSGDSDNDGRFRGVPMTSL